MFDRAIWKKQADIICKVLEKAPEFDKQYYLPPEEFAERQKKVWEMLQQEGYDLSLIHI